jgi:hypothetical protein
VSDGVINRPATEFDGAAFGIGSAWGFRVGYEGAWEVYDGDERADIPTPDDLRAELQRRGLTPWGTRDRAADRGNWAHDLLEGLATDGSSVKALEDVDGEYRGHGRAVLQWFLDYRPEFVATEVQQAHLPAVALRAARGVRVVQCGDGIPTDRRPPGPQYPP